MKQSPTSLLAITKRASSCKDIRNRQKNYFNSFFYICLVGGAVQVGLLGMAATDWPIVSAPVDYDDGEFGGTKIGRGN
jgi:hypothetical protein